MATIEDHIRLSTNTYPIFEMAETAQRICDSSALKAFQNAIQIPRASLAMQTAAITAQLTQAQAITAAAFHPAIEAVAMYQPPYMSMAAAMTEYQRTLEHITRIPELIKMQEKLHQMSRLFPTVQVSMPNVASTLPAFEYLEVNQPELCQQVEDALAIQAPPDDSADNIKAYMLFCTEIIIGLEGVKELAADPAIKAGCVSLIIIFSSLLAYLKYCKEEQ